jgi:hypothetical protein
MQLEPRHPWQIANSATVPALTGHGQAVCGRTGSQVVGCRHTVLVYVDPVKENTQVLIVKLVYNYY